MNTERAERPILYGCLGILLFLICDTYFLPNKISEEQVAQVITHEQRFKRAKLERYEVVTNKRSFEIYKDLIYKIHNNDTIFLRLSRITNTLLKIGVKQGHQIQEINNGYITTFKGSIFVPLLLTTIIISLIFFRRFPHPPGRRNLVILVTVLTFIQLYYYLIHSTHY